MCINPQRAKRIINAGSNESDRPGNFVKKREGVVSTARQMDVRPASRHGPATVLPLTSLEARDESACILFSNVRTFFVTKSCVTKSCFLVLCSLELIPAAKIAHYCYSYSTVWHFFFSPMSQPQSLKIEIAESDYFAADIW